MRDHMGNAKRIGRRRGLQEALGRADLGCGA
jgi:hypothetical protein